MEFTISVVKLLSDRRDQHPNIILHLLILLAEATIIPQIISFELIRTMLAKSPYTQPPPGDPPLFLGHHLYT